jgi:hypothetical protein
MTAISLMGRKAVNAIGNIAPRYTKPPILCNYALEIVCCRFDLDIEGSEAIWLIQEFNSVFKIMIREPLLLRVVYRYPLPHRTIPKQHAGKQSSYLRDCNVYLDGSVIMRPPSCFACFTMDLSVYVVRGKGDRYAKMGIRFICRSPLLAL